jgi:hypothetical protein
LSDQEAQALRDEVMSLRARVAELENQLLFLQTHGYLADGIRGETLVCRLTGGTASALGAGYDVRIGEALKVEVKFSRLRIPVQGAATRRWQWSRPLGWKNYGKDYELLLLIGEKDSRFASQYPDGSPYVYFLVPRAGVQELMTVDRHMGAGHITVSTNLIGSRSPRSTILRKYLVPFAKIQKLNPVATQRSCI